MTGPVELTGRFQDALAFAAQAHQGQAQKGTAIPYVAHLLSVCALVLADGGDEDEAIAALLHDTLEDQPERVSREQIAARFGPRVLQIVEACTDTPAEYKGGEKPPWRARKETHLAHIRGSAPAACRVPLADKLDNARSILRDCRQLGDELWSRFNAGKDEQLWYYRGLIAAFRGAGAASPMLAELARTVYEIEGLARDV